MAKSVARFVCQSCGAVTAKWAGKCETCGEWNTIAEEPEQARPGPARKPGARYGIAVCHRVPPPGQMFSNGRTFGHGPHFTTVIFGGCQVWSTMSSAGR